MLLTVTIQVKKKLPNLDLKSGGQASCGIYIKMWVQSSSHPMLL